MNIRKPLFAIRLIAAFAAGTVLAFPCLSLAVGIGEITLQSRLGDPLRAQVELSAASSEQVDSSCLSLLPPEQNEDPSGYLTSAVLSLQMEGSHQHISIVSRKPFNGAFAKLRLQVKCPGMGSSIRTFTVLPDLGEPAPQVPITAPVVPAAPPAAPPAIHDAAPVASPHNAPDTSPPAAKPRPSSTRTTAKRHRSTSGKQSAPAAFRLKLSGDPIDESRIGKISPEERAALLAQQKLLDADDQMASFLALQHQVKLLQEELGEIKLQLAQLGPPPASSQVAAAPVAEPDNQGKRRLTATAKPPVPQDSPYLQNGLFAALGLLAVLTLWLGLRYYNKVKSRAGIKPFRNEEPIPGIAPVATAVPPASPRPLSTTSIKKPLAAQPGMSHIPDEVPAPATPPPAIDEEMSEDEAMMEEARLYVALGRPVKSIEILQEVTRRFPSKAEGWSLMLSIYSSLGKTAEFGNAARSFLEHHKDSPLWSGIQALGRTLDPDEPLYADRQGAAARLLAASVGGPRQQIGDILMEMGVLSQQDLQNCLDDYDSQKHGRFGGYLVARKAITLAQLDQALLQQQGIRPETQGGDLPSLQDMENLLADFDPKRDGSVGEFLASRDAAAAKEFSDILQRSQPAGTSPQPDDKPLFDKHEMLDFVLDTPPERPELDLEFEPLTPGNNPEENKPLDFEIEPAPKNAQAAPHNASLDFPEIQLDFGSDELSNDNAGKP